MVIRNVGNVNYLIYFSEVAFAEEDTFQSVRHLRQAHEKIVCARLAISFCAALRLMCDNASRVKESMSW